MIWIWILIWVFIDIFRSRDLSGWAKALWFLFVLFIPLIGVLVYLRPRLVDERAAASDSAVRTRAAGSYRPGAGRGEPGWLRQPGRRPFFETLV